MAGKAKPKQKPASAVKRKSTRFRAEEPAFAILNRKVASLAFSESAKGCGLVVLSTSCPDEGDEVVVKVGALAALKGVVRWRKEIDSDVCKIGIEYLE